MPIPESHRQFAEIGWGLAIMIALLTSVVIISSAPNQPEIKSCADHYQKTVKYVENIKATAMIKHYEDDGMLDGEMKQKNVKVYCYPSRERLSHSYCGAFDTQGKFHYMLLRCIRR